MKRIKEFFLLKDDMFFELLIKLSKCAYECSKEFECYVRDYEKMKPEERDEKLRVLSRYEKDGDILVREISEELYKNFITPIDREDIHALASNLDTTIDMMEEIGKKISYYRFEATSPIMKTQASISSEQMEAIAKVISRLKESKDLKEEYRKVFELEDKADAIYETAMTDLFDPKDPHLANNPLLVIKLKDIYDELEDITDLNQQLAAIIEGIIIKHV